MLRNCAAIVLALMLLVAGSSLPSWSRTDARAADTQPENTQQSAGNGAEPEEKQVLPSPRDGIILVIGTEIREGQQVPPDRVVTVKIGDEVKKYRRLRKGDMVDAGQLVGRLDDRLARHEVAIKKFKLDAALADLTAAVKTRDETYTRWQTIVDLSKQGKDVSPDQIRDRKLTHDRYVSEAQAKKAVVEVAKQELRQAETLLETYELRSAIRGTIKDIYKYRGEGVKCLEPVMLIHGSTEQK